MLGRKRRLKGHKQSTDNAFAGTIRVWGGGSM